MASVTFENIVKDYRTKGGYFRAVHRLNPSIEDRGSRVRRRRRSVGVRQDDHADVQLFAADNEGRRIVPADA